MKNEYLETELRSSVASSAIPCTADELEISPDDCYEGKMEQWLEDEALIPGFRVWQLVGIVLSIFLTITIGFCCCIRFRIPRTKQTIEADYIRKRITKDFRKELNKLSNTDMDEMDLRKALERVQADLDAEEQELQKHQDVFIEKPLKEVSLRARFRAMFDGVRTKFSKNPPSQLQNVI